MKEAVCEHIQALCRQDTAFARRTMAPEKSMINCFQYINRKAQEYAEQEMKDNGIKRTGVYGLDVPDGLCYQWAEDYFNDPDAKEDHKDDEKFIPKPYISAGRKATQGKAGKDRQRLLRWQLERNVTRDVNHILEHVTAHKFMRYMDGQFAALHLDGSKGRYGNMQYAVSEYRDYLDMCVKLDYDMANSFVLYPKDLKQAHDKAQGRVKAKADAQLRRDFKAAMQAISRHQDFESEDMRILLPTTPEELAVEGNALHHFVGSYADRVVRHECIILLLRQCDNLSKPFFTIEVRGGKITQVRGMKNCSATPEVDAFMDSWERKVLQAIQTEQAA